MKADHVDRSTASRVTSLRLLRRDVVIAMVVNVLAVVILLIVTSVLHGQLNRDPCPVPPPVLTHADVIRPRDVIRYCYREDPVVCQEKGYHVKNDTDGNSVCCGNTANYVYSVMSEAIKARLQVDTYRGRLFQKIKQFITRLDRNPQTAAFRPTAHVGILPNGNLTGPDNEAPRIQWDKSGQWSFLSGGIIHKGDRLAVTTPGFYYVYAGLQFDMDPNKTQWGGVVAYLYRTVNATRDSRKKLMTSRESSCHMTRGGKVGPVSMHMAGVFMLRPDDEISVRTSSQSFLHRSGATTYLGLHMV
ncbi:lymphotoxin-alpha-like [Babylonia areolata]|uniref:lymphotoxin-alpha-like n=1 Tax=Babylonia areolata TaxID=304850 RepID=UPI003FD0229D